MSWSSGSRPCRPDCAAPLAAWLRGSLLAPVERALAEPAFADAGLFDPAAVRRLIEQHRSGRSDHGRLIWALFMFGRFLTRVHEPEAARLTDGMAGSAAFPTPSLRVSSSVSTS